MLILDKPDAIAAFGTLRKLEGVHTPGLLKDPHWADKVVRAVGRGAVDIVIDLDELAHIEFSSAQIDELCGAWKKGAENFKAALPNRALRLQLCPSGTQIDFRVASVLRRANFVNSIVFVDRGLDGPDRWGWPLEVKAIGNASEAAVETYPHPDLLKFDTPGKPVTAYDLLVIDSLEDFLAMPIKGLSSGFLLVMTSQTGVFTVETVRRLNELIGFRAAVIVAEQLSLRSVIQIFLDELSHNNPPDVAICNAMEHNSDHIIVGDPGFLNKSRVTVSTAVLEDRLERDFLDGLIDSDEFITMATELETLPSAVDTNYWYSERGAATDAAVRSVPVMEEMEAAGSPVERPVDPNERYLQVQVFKQTNGELIQRILSFEAAALHRIDVRIGPSNLNWINAPHAFPDFQLPRNEARVTVTLSVPSCSDQPMSREILVGPTGTSTVAMFDLHLPADLTKLNATINVYHEGKHLQSCILSGPVTNGEDSPEATGIDISRGLPSSADLDHQQAFDLVVWKNGDELELSLFDPSATADEPSNKVLNPSLGGVSDMVTGIREELFKAASKIDQLESDIETSGLPAILSLAEQGEFLRRKLFEPGVPDRIRRVQVVSPDSADFFPVEFFYDFVMPDLDAKLCPEFKKSKIPNCSPDCHAAKGDSAFVCPSGFWALNRVIERQVRPLDRADSIQSESSATQPHLQTPASIIFSASDEVNASDATEIDQTVNAMAGVASVHQAHTWKEWVDLVSENYPSLLVTLPHNVESKPFNRLRISASQDLPLNRIKAKYIKPAAAPQGPAMLLLGCNTANPDVGYQDFVNEMRCNGASLVVATLTYVLGPQAARVAREFVRQIGVKGKDQTIGEIMQQVRARMLAEDNMMALAITAFGDADWRFGEWEN